MITSTQELKILLKKIATEANFNFALYGSAAINFEKAKDIDLLLDSDTVLSKEETLNPRVKKALISVAKQAGKKIDAFFSPILEGSEMGKVLITPEGKVSYESVFVGKGFFEGVGQDPSNIFKVLTKFSNINAGANGTWKSEGISIHAVTDYKSMENFLKTHETDFSHLNQGPAYVAKNSVFAVKDSKIIGFICFADTDQGLIPTETKVEEAYQRKGIASAMLDEMKKVSGKKILRSDNESSDGKAFFEHYMKSSTGLPTLHYLKSTFPELAKAAQGVYDNWTQEPGEYDPYNGGGICHDIADEMCKILDKKGIPCSSVSSSHEQHVYVAVQVEEGTYSLDIHHGYYETGGGFTWKKIPDVQFVPEMISIYRVGDADEFESYIESSVTAGANGDWKKEGFKLSFTESVWEPTGTEHLDVDAKHPKFGHAGTANFTKIWNSKGEPCWYPNNVTVDKWAQQKGLGQAMVEFAVEQTGIKLANTVDLSAAGKELAKKVDRKFIAEASGGDVTSGANGDWKAEGYEIHVVGPVDFEGADDGEAEAFMKKNPKLRPIDISATDPDGEYVGDLRVGRTKDLKNIYIWDVNIEEEHRRKGLASAMYQAAEKYFKLKLKAGVSGLSEDSKALWESANRSFGGIKDKDYPYYHVSDYPEMPTIPKDLVSKEGGRRGKAEPLGLFLFIKGKPVLNEGFHKRKYRWDAKLKSSTKLYSTRDLPDAVLKYIKFENFIKNGKDLVEDYDRALYDFKDYCGGEDLPLDRFSFEQWLEEKGTYWEALVCSVANSHELTRILKSNGVQAILDESGENFFVGEPQVCVIDTSVIEWLEREVNGVDEEVYRLEGSVTARKNIGILYHFTTPERLLRVAQEGFKLRTENREAISLTRNGALKFQPDIEARDEDGDTTGNYHGVDASVRIAIDGDKLSDRYKIEPYTDSSSGRMGPLGQEAEERIKKTEVYIGNAIYQIDILKGFSYEKEEGEGFKYQDEALPEAIALCKRAGHEVHEVSSFHNIWASVEASTNPNLWYHITDNPKFKLDPDYEPEDNATHIYQRTGNGIYLSQMVETWVNGHNYWRPFVVEFEVDPTVKEDKGVHGKYGGEMFVPSTSFDKLKILRVIPLDAYAREEFGGYGWIESEIGKEFDTDQPLNTNEIYPFKGYHYSGPDVRDMSSAETTRLKRMLKKVKGSVTSMYTDHPNTWIHYSRIPEVKVNPQTMFRDPAGIYLFPSDFTPIGNWTKFPFKFEVTLKDGIKVLDLGLITEEEMKSIWNHFFPGVALNLEDAVHTTKADYWWEQLVNRMMTKQGEANKKFRELGYDAIFDDTGVIHSSEEQLLVLNPKVLKSIKRIENKSSGFQEMVEILKHFEPLAESYGDVKIEGPLKKKELYAKTPTLTATLKISNGDNNAAWSLTVGEIEKGLGVPHHISLSLRYSSPDIKFSIGRSFGYTFQFNDWKQGLADAEKEFFLAMDRIFKRVESSVDTTREDLEKQGYEFEQIIEQNYGKDFLTINVIYSGKRVGQIECTISAVDPTKLNPLGIKVDPAHRRKGVASALYKLAEEYYGLPFGDTLSRSPEGIKFRKAYDKRTTSKLFFKGSEEKPYIEVYRIEKNGKGPYSDPKKDENYNWFWEDPEHGGFDVHPTPSDDGFEPSEISILNGDKFSGNVLFGFKNLEQLNNWFSEKSRKALLEDGYKIVKRKASEVWEGKSQVLFRPYMDTVTSKTNTLTKQDWKEIADSIESWVSTADPESFMYLKHISPQLPKELRQYDGELFRGHKSTKANYAKLKAGARFKIRASSWSIDESEAAKFALNGDAGYYGDQTVRTLFKVTPTPSQVLLNLQEAVEHPILGKLLQRTTKEGILNEGEVILKDIQVSKDNLANLEQVAKDYGYEEYYDEAKEKDEVAAALNVEFHTVLLDFFECSSEKDFNFFNLQREIPKEDIYEEHPYQTDFPNGLEQKPHVTVLFGLVHEHDLFPIRKYFTDQPPIKFTIGEVKAFRNDDKPYDVLVVEIKSEDLEKHHWWVRDNFVTESKFPDYKAHMTLAYIKKGTCKDLEGPMEWLGTEYTCSNLKFSHKDNMMFDMPLNVGPQGPDVDKLDTQNEYIATEAAFDLQDIDYIKASGNYTDKDTKWKQTSEFTNNLQDLRKNASKKRWVQSTTGNWSLISKKFLVLEDETVILQKVETFLRERNLPLTLKDDFLLALNSQDLKYLEIRGNPSNFDSDNKRVLKVRLKFQEGHTTDSFRVGFKATQYNVEDPLNENPLLLTDILLVDSRDTFYPNLDSITIAGKVSEKDAEFRWTYSETDGMLSLEVFDIATGKLAGSALINPIHADMYEYHFSEEEKENPNYEELTAYEYVTTLESLQVEPEFRGEGLSKKILNLILTKARKRYPDYPMYLNASPMGYAKESGLGLTDLVNLYMRAGFKMYEKYPDNVTMWMESPKGVRTIAGTDMVEVAFIGNKLQTWEQVYYTTYLNYLCKRLDISPKKITIRSLSAQKGNKFGYVGEMKSKENVKLSVVFGGPWVTLSRIAHEMIHVKQFIKDELSVDKDKTNLNWGGQKFISVEEYNNLGTKPSDYHHVPWEKEAYENQDKFTKDFLKSDELYELASVKVPFVDMKALIKEIYEGTKVIAAAGDLFEQTYQEYKTAFEAGEYRGYRAPSESLHQELKNNIAPFTQGGLIYRAISAPNEDAINFDKIGIYWSFKKEGARVYWGDFENNKIFVITAKVSPESIDWLGTIEANAKMVYGGEEEIKLKDKAEVEVVKVEYLEGYGTPVDTGLPKKKAAAEVQQ